MNHLAVDIVSDSVCVYESFAQVSQHSTEERALTHIHSYRHIFYMNMVMIVAPVNPVQKSHIDKIRLNVGNVVVFTLSVISEFYRLKLNYH